ncbi:MAG: OmpH family outer membrane protein [Alistipes sp.]|nr:OmpH family outer membrane protein [Alistipes sp.]
MKKIIKLTLTVVCVLSASTMFAQKFGRVNMQEIILAMPEVKEMELQLENLGKDWREQLETIQVEFNNKLNDYQKDKATLSATAQQIRERELQDLQNRYAEFQQMAQQEMERQQAELLQPIQKKANDAVKKVAESGGYTAVIDTSLPTMAYINESTVTDISDAVRKQLGITAPATK